MDPFSLLSSVLHSERAITHHVFSYVPRWGHRTHRPLPWPAMVFSPCPWLCGRVEWTGEALWGCGARRIDFHFFLHEACLRFVVSSLNGSTTLACLHFHGKSMLHLDTRGWSEREDWKPSWVLMASSKSWGHPAGFHGLHLAFYMGSFQQLTTGRRRCVPMSKHLQDNQVLPTVNRTCLGIDLGMRVTKTWKHPLHGTAPKGRHKSQLHLT